MSQSNSENIQKKLMQLIRDESGRGHQDAATRADGLTRLTRGESPEEIASAMGVALSTVQNNWRRPLEYVREKLEAGQPVDSIKNEFDRYKDPRQRGRSEFLVPGGQSADTEDAVNGAAEAPKDAPDIDWYIIHTYSGFENKVKESLRTRADSFGFAERVGEILIPTEDVIEMRNGKKVTTKRLLYPGYVLVQLALDDELWHVVKNTPRVTGFVGGGHDPQPLTADEVNQILHRQIVSAERPRPKMEFSRNDRVKIVDGPFASFSGSVEEVNEDRSTVKVMVTIFGRGTPVELEYFQVEKES